MWCLLSALALAAPDVDFVHADDAPKSARYLKVDGTPPRARLKNAKGPYEAWTWRDGRLARVLQWDGKTLVADHRYDAVGDPWATLAYGDGAVTEVVVHGRTDAAVPVGAWATWTLGAASLRLPSVRHGADGALASELGEVAWRGAWGPVGDPFSDGYRDALLATCACELVDRYTVYADGRPGAGYLVRVPGPEAPRLAELLAFPDPAGTLLLATTAPTGFDAPGVDDPAVRLAPGRAIAALVRWTPAAKEPTR